jgi:hypothetical protein
LKTPQLSNTASTLTGNRGNSSQTQDMVGIARVLCQPYPALAGPSNALQTLITRTCCQPTASPCNQPSASPSRMLPTLDTSQHKLNPRKPRCLATHACCLCNSSSPWPSFTLHSMAQQHLWRGHTGIWHVTIWPRHRHRPGLSTAHPLRYRLSPVTQQSPADNAVTTVCCYFQRSSPITPAPNTSSSSGRAMGCGASACLSSLIEL